jgi:hypothetical protein
MPDWIKKRVLITVRSYPLPSAKSVEASCTAGITDDGKWIRLYPVPYRLLDDSQKFKKYQWVTIDVAKARNDRRPESHNPRLDQIQIGETLPPNDAWRARWSIIRPLLGASMCSIQRERDEHGFPTLAIVKPREITALSIEDSEPNWTPKQQASLNQGLLFDVGPAQKLKKIPFDFKYEFKCGDPACKGHKMTCTDWEMAEAYRAWRERYGNKWQSAFRNKFEIEMTKKFDTHFFVGNQHQAPTAWIIVGLFYPPKREADLFDGL